MLAAVITNQLNFNLSEDLEEMDLVNLDVSTMISWVSEITHGGHICSFENRFLQEQAEQENRERVWPLLQSATHGKEMIVCEMALKSFEEIVEVSGGPLEQERARELVKQVRVVADAVSQRVAELRETSNIKAKTKIVFGTGDSYKAVTITANKGFVQAANQQGVVLATLVHPPRSLAEQFKNHSK